MHVFMLLIIALLPCSYAVAYRADDVPIYAERVYVPHGFDSNDESEVIVSGWLPNTCYRRPVASVVTENGVHRVKLQATKSVGAATVCIQAAVPYLVTATLGQLAAGKHMVVVHQRQKPELTAEFSVNEASTQSIDDHVYANVQSVSQIPETRTVSLTGMNPSDCFALDRIELVSNQSDTYAILPVLKQVKPECEKRQVYFHYQVEIPSDLAPEKLLLHVRRMEGTSVNFLFDNR